MKETNPYLQDTDYFSEYNENIENLKNKPEIVSLDKLCYEVFEMNPLGKELLQQLESKYVMPSLVNLHSRNFQIEVIYQEGWKEAFRFLRKCVISHMQRIKAETNK